MRPVTAFHFDLVQDVATLRPIARLAAGMESELLFLLSPAFEGLDAKGVWMNELRSLAEDIGAEVMPYRTPFEVTQRLSSRRGICIAGSESTVPAHRRTHDLFRAMPAGVLRITLQHGFECVGFLHNERHSATMGSDVGFASDVIVGWFDRTRLKDVAPSQAGKLYVAGPGTLIDKPSGRATSPDAYDPYSGVVCENTHSVRFGSSEAKDEFVAQVRTLGVRLARIGKKLTLRPHPAGQFLNQGRIAASDSLEISDAPMYRLDLSRYSFAISAPSTVLFDFMLAGVPVGLWGRKPMDASNFAGLPIVENEEDCWALINASVTSRPALMAAQTRFMENLGIPQDVRGRYQALLALSASR